MMATQQNDGSAKSDRANGRSMGEAVRVAVEQFTALVGREPQSVTGARRTDEGGWSVLIDVVELERIPASTSVMATYRVDLDGSGELESYERLRRFNVGATDSS